MIIRQESWTVASDDACNRLDQFLVRKLPGESRSQVQNWIRLGYLLVNGGNAKTGYRTRTNDQITLRIPVVPENTPQPEKIPLEILFEDSDLALINKPAGIVCHHGAGIRSGTLVNALLYHMGPLDTGNPSRPGIVHRLDKDTSGVMVIAKNVHTHRKLSQQFKNRSVQKEYLALVYGHPASESGTIDVPIGRHPRDRKKISTRAKRSRSAVTHFSLEKKYPRFSLLRIRIETGRTHQIRVHLAHKGHPVVGDTVYGGRKYMDLSANLLASVKSLQRPFLHSHRLTLRHPATGKPLSAEADLPEELRSFLECISIPSD